MMDKYSAETMVWLDQRFRKTDEDGIYFAHQPIYGFRAGHCESMISERYIKTIRILKKLSLYKIGSLLDVGAAEGYKAYLAHRLLCIDHVECCDLSAEAAKRAEEIFKLQSRQADIHRLPYEDRRFDAVVCSETLEHVADVSQAVSELTRVAGKLIIITVPNEKPEMANSARERQETHGHINAFTQSTLDHLKDEGWDVFHERLCSARLRILRMIVDAEIIDCSKKKGIKKIAVLALNICSPLFRAACNRYVTAASIWLDALMSRLWSGNDAHVYVLLRKEIPCERIAGKNVSILKVLNFSVPLYPLKNK